MPCLEYASADKTFKNVPVSILWISFLESTTFKSPLNAGSCSIICFAAL